MKTNTTNRTQSTATPYPASWTDGGIEYEGGVDISMIKLSPKREAFCQEFVKDHNATQAYIRAGYSPNGADVSGSQLLGIASVAARVAELAEKAAKRNDLAVDDVIKVWKDVINDPDEPTPNKLVAARDAGKYLGMFIEKRQVDVKGEIHTYAVSDIRAHKKNA